MWAYQMACVGENVGSRDLTPVLNWKIVTRIHCVEAQEPKEPVLPLNPEELWTKQIENSYPKENVMRSMLAYASCNLSSWENEAKTSQDGGRSGLLSERSCLNQRENGMERKKRKLHIS